MKNKIFDKFKKNGTARHKIVNVFLDNAVLILFLFICGVGLLYADQPANYIINQVTTRFFRNIVLVLSLIVPVWAGMGLNFSIVVGAMSAQAGMIISLNYDISGVIGILSSFLFGSLIATMLGFLTGKLFNRTKGQEMITGMILGFFANGIYQLIFMYLCGPVFPVRNTDILLPNGVGINGIITLDKSLGGALDKLWMLTLDNVLWVVIIVLTVYYLIKLLRTFVRKETRGFKSNYLPFILLGVSSLLLYIFSNYWEAFISTSIFTRVPMITGLIAGMVCLFITFLGNTKLGSDIKAVGQSMPIARAAGINVEKTRIIAIVFSTIIAAIGQVIYLQNLGTLTTYSAADQIGTFSVAALLVGGASIIKANIGHAVLGTILFHLMFIVAPIAGKNIFGDAQIGEYFRVFVSYAVIAISLALHAWTNQIKISGKR